MNRGHRGGNRPDQREYNQGGNRGSHQGHTGQNYNNDQNRKRASFNPDVNRGNVFQQQNRAGDYHPQHGHNLHQSNRGQSYSQRPDSFSGNRGRQNYAGAQQQMQQQQPSYHQHQQGRGHQPQYGNRQNQRNPQYGQPYSPQHGQQQVQQRGQQHAQHGGQPGGQRSNVPFATAASQPHASTPVQSHNPFASVSSATLGNPFAALGAGAGAAPTPFAAGTAGVSALNPFQSARTHPQPQTQALRQQHQQQQPNDFTRQPRAAERGQGPLQDQDRRPVCVHFTRPRGCRDGDRCRFRHVRDGAVDGQQLQQPQQQRQQEQLGSAGAHGAGAGGKGRAGVEVCRKFLTPQGCKFGARCRYSHDMEAAGQQPQLQVQSQPQGQQLLVWGGTAGGPPSGGNPFAVASAHAGSQAIQFKPSFGGTTANAPRGNPFAAAVTASTSVVTAAWGAVTSAPTGFPFARSGAAGAGAGQSFGLNNPFATAAGWGGSAGTPAWGQPQAGADVGAMEVDMGEGAPAAQPQALGTCSAFTQASAPAPASTPISAPAPAPAAASTPSMFDLLFPAAAPPPSAQPARRPVVFARSDATDAAWRAPEFDWGAVPLEPPQCLLPEASQGLR